MFEVSKFADSRDISSNREHEALTRAGEFLGAASRQVGLLARLVPVNARQERERVAAAWAASTRAMPHFSYAAADLDAMRGDLARFADHAALGDFPLGDALRERAWEIALEADMIAFRGTRSFGTYAARRFSAFSPELRTRAAALAETWLRAPHEGPVSGVIATDDEAHAGSLVSRLRAEIARASVPFSVVVTAGLSALAATGHDTVFVAAGRSADRETIERTVMHEVLGHVLPRVRAARTRHPLFVVGSARGTCDQEGYALVLEERHGFLNVRRKRELALRHVLAESMRAGADFADAVELAIEQGETTDAALRIAERAYRGGSGAGPGLGREIVYIASYLRVKDRCARDPSAERVLAAGQVRCEWLDAAAPFV